MFDLENPFNKFFIQLMLSQTVSNAHSYMTWQQVYFKMWITSSIKCKKFLSQKKNLKTIKHEFLQPDRS